MQLSSCLASKTADRQRPKPARIVPFVVIRIGSGTDGFGSRAASLNSSITPVQPSSSSARCSRSCSGERTTGRHSSQLIALGLKDCGGTPVSSRIPCFSDRNIPLNTGRARVSHPIQLHCSFNAGTVWRSINLSIEFCKTLTARPTLTKSRCFRRKRQSRTAARLMPSCCAASLSVTSFVI
jgi:hypothetical protein